MSLTTYRPSPITREGQAYLRLQQRCLKLEAKVLDLKVKVAQLRAVEPACLICGKAWHTGHTPAERAACDAAL